MVEVDDKIIEIVKRYIERLRKAGIHVEKVYLFGSFARGEENPLSDIDVAVISSDFSGDMLEDRARLKELRWDVDVRIDPFPIHPDDAVPENPVYAEIIKTGVEVWSE